MWQRWRLSLPPKSRTQSTMTDMLFLHVGGVRMMISYNRTIRWRNNAHVRAEEGGGILLLPCLYRHCRIENDTSIVSRRFWWNWEILGKLRFSGLVLVAACYLGSYFLTGDSNYICRKSLCYATKIAITYDYSMCLFKLCVTIVCTTTE
jgi:hypothetical protein